MTLLLLSIIYLAFIGLGLPDSLLGSAWPLMVGELQVPLSYAGIISMIISGGTIISSLLSDKLTQKLGTGLVTAISILMTAGALLGFSLANSFWLLCILAIPYGFGAGAVDAGLNNYVALHYASKHMSWLHCFWGVGASIGPYVIAWAIGAQHDWRLGYSTISGVQIMLSLVLFLTLPLWKKASDPDSRPYEAPLGLKDALKIKGVKGILLAFFGYCAFEATAGLWASSYLVTFKGVHPETAAAFASLFYLGITAGRFFCGFLADRIGDKNMIRIGVGIMLGGILLIALPFRYAFWALAGLVIIGIGAAPVYPSIIHATPIHFGKENSHAIVGIQMASAYCGSTFMPPVFGLIVQYVHIGIYPFYMAVFVMLLLVMTERVNKIAKDSLFSSHRVI